MRLLLDTHVLIWWSGGHPIAPAAADAIRAPESEVVVSAASVWEAEIKAAAGKLLLTADLEAEPAQHGFRSLDISVAHAVAAARLPPHHTDPFDRMLVAQAQLEGLTLVTRDPCSAPMPCRCSRRSSGAATALVFATGGAPALVVPAGWPAPSAPAAGELGRIAGSGGSPVGVDAASGRIRRQPVDVERRQHRPAAALGAQVR